MDYCNVVLTGLQSTQLNRLQTVINAAARVVFSGRRCDHITPILHWLRVPERTVEFSLPLSTWHRSWLPVHHLPVRVWRNITAASIHVCSGATSQPVVACTVRCSTLGDRAFPVPTHLEQLRHHHLPAVDDFKETFI